MKYTLNEMRPLIPKHTRQRSDVREFLTACFFVIFFVFLTPVALAAVVGDGVILYDETTPTTSIQERTWTEGTATVGAESSPFAGSGTSKHMFVKGSKTREEMIMGIQDSTGLLTIYKSADNGASWVSQWTATVGDGNLRRFDIAYEQTSGDALVVYSANVGTTNELKYQTWNGTSWSGALNLDPTRTSGTVYGIRIVERQSSNEIGVVWVDTNFDLSANVWTGSAWYGEPAAALSVNISKIGVNTVPTNRAYDLSFEGLSGDLMIVWGEDAVLDPKYVIKPAGGAWGSVVAPTTFNEEGTMMDISPSPTSDRIAYVNCTDNGGDCDFTVWSGSAWGTTLNDATAGTPVVGDGGNNVDWLVDGVNEVAIMTYGDTAVGGLDWAQSTNGATPVLQTDNTAAPAIAAAERAAFAKVSPADPKQGLFFFVDANLDIFVKKASLSGTTVTWSSPTGASAALETATTFAGMNPVGFAYVKYSAASTLTIGATAGSKVANLNSGDTNQYAQTTSCTSAATCAAFTLSLDSGSDTLTSIKLTQNGTINGTVDLANVAIFYDTDGNYSNGVTGQFGSTVASLTANTATVSGSLALSAGTTYYFYVRTDLINGANNPRGGQTINYQIAASADVTVSGSAIKTGAPATLAGTTTIRPQVTGYTNSTESGLNYAASCTGCGARLGGGSGFRQSISISGYGFGSDPGLGSRDTATNKVEIVGGATTALIDDGSVNTNVSSWASSTIVIRTDSSIAGNTDTDWGANFGGASALNVTAGGQGTPVDLNFYLFPQVTSVTQPAGLPADAAREYDGADSDGVITLNGTRFGTAQGTGYVRILGCDVTTCASPSGSVAINSWGNTAITVQVPTVIADNTYTGTIAMQQGVGGNSKIHTYANTLRILPRITGLTPASGSVGDAMSVDGNHFCQTGTCPLAFDANNKVTFTSAIDVIVFTSWSPTAMSTQVPTGAVTGNVVLKSNAYDSNGALFTVLSPTPNDPTSLNQWKDAALLQFITTGGSASATPIRLTMTMEVGISGGTLYPQIEYKQIGTAFSCGAGVCGGAIEGTGVAGPGPIDCAVVGNSCVISISPADDIYHWQARVRHNKSGSDYYSAWVSFPTPIANLESETDIKIDTTPPAITNISSGTPGSNGATITWDTLAEAGTSQVQYNKTGTFVSNCATNNDCTTLDMSFVTGHSVLLTNLDSGETYYYRVRSRDAAGNETISVNNTFTTASVTQPAKTVRFHLMSFGTTVAGAAATSSTFTIVIPENATSTKSMFVEFRAIYNTTGSAPNGIAVQVNAEPSRTYVSPTGGASIGHVKILHQVNAINVEPGTNTLTITPETNTSLSALSADIVITYAYTP